MFYLYVFIYIQIYIAHFIHSCVCTNGYLDKDGKSCKPVNSFAFFAKRNEILTLHLNKFDVLTPPYKAIKEFSNVIGIDFDFKTERIFFSDISNNVIGMVYLNGTDKRILASGKLGLDFLFLFMDI